MSPLFRLAVTALLVAADLVAAERIRPWPNLIFSPEHQAIVGEMNTKLFATLKETDGMFIPLQPDRGGSANLRREAGSKPANFPRELMRKKDRFQ